jgi:hypothetical protein
LGEAGEHQKIELYRRFFPNASLAEAQLFLDENCAATMAEFQGLLLECENRVRDSDASLLVAELDPREAVAI